MKTKSYLIGLLLLAAGLFAFTSVKGNPNQSEKRVDHAAVMVGDGDRLIPRPGGGNIAIGRVVDWVDASPGIPVVEQNTSMSATIAYYMSLGFSHEMISARTHLFKR